MNQTSFTCPCCGKALTASDGAPLPFNWQQLVALLITILQSLIGGGAAECKPKA